MVTGTIRSQIKMMLNDNMWQKKKQDINSGKITSLTPEERMIEQFEEQAAKERERRGASDIYSKLQSGGTLTAEEMKYLKKNDPAALAQYENAQNEKKAYKHALKNCRTKEEVEQLKLNRMGKFAAEVKKIANDPYIPTAKKEELLKKINNEMCLINKVNIEFYESGAYAKLPDKDSPHKDDLNDDGSTMESADINNDGDNTNDTVTIDTAIPESASDEADETAKRCKTQNV